jgi:hypothetical protein
MQRIQNSGANRGKAGISTAEDTGLEKKCWTQTTTLIKLFFVDFDKSPFGKGLGFGSGLFFGQNQEDIPMKMTKGHEPNSKGGGMKAHNPASPGNNPTTSRECGKDFSDKNKPAGSSSPRHHTASKQSGVS